MFQRTAVLPRNSLYSFAKRYMPCFDFQGKTATPEQQETHDEGQYYFNRVKKSPMSKDLRKAFQKIDAQTKKFKGGNDYNTYYFSDLCNMRSLIVAYCIRENPNEYLLDNLSEVIYKQQKHRLNDIQCTIESLDLEIAEMEETLLGMMEKREELKPMLERYSEENHNISSATVKDLKFWMSDETFDMINSINSKK